MQRTLPSDLLAEFHRAAEQLRHGLAAARGCVLATVDGRLLVESVDNGADPQRIAAMVGSMVALGETIGREVRIERSDYVVVHGTKGILMMQRVPAAKPWLVVATLADSGTNLGIVLHHTRRTAADIGAVFDEWLSKHQPKLG